LNADSIAESTVASVATLVRSERERRKLVESSVIKAPAMIERKATMMSTPLKTLPRWERRPSFRKALKRVTD
jgi:hypothetical protein